VANPFPSVEADFDARAAASAPVEARVPRFTTAEEKRRLILAHAEMRQRRTLDPVQRRSLWAGVLVSFAAIVGTWAWIGIPSYVDAAKSSVQRPVSPQLADELAAFRDRLKSLEGTGDAVEAAAKDVFAAAGVPEGRSDLFQPVPTSTATSTAH
jgi:cell division protein FtsB